MKYLQLPEITPQEEIDAEERALRSAFRRRWFERVANSFREHALLWAVIVPGSVALFTAIWMFVG